MTVIENTLEIIKLILFNIISIRLHWIYYKCNKQNTKNNVSYLKKYCVITNISRARVVSLIILNSISSTLSERDITIYCSNNIDVLTSDILSQIHYHQPVEVLSNFQSKWRKTIFNYENIL